MSQTVNKDELIDNMSREIVRLSDQVEAQKQRAEIEESKRKGGFTHFVMLNTDIEDALNALGRENPTAFVLLHYFARNCNRDNTLAVSRETISEAIPMSGATFARCLAVLKRYNFIEVKRTKNGNIYYINPQFSWKSHGYNRPRCPFGSGTVGSDIVIAEKNTKTRYKVIKGKKKGEDT